MNWEALIAVSRLLADFPNSSDSETEIARLKRAVSTVYYAMFHALAQNNADTLAGESAAQRGTAAWRRIYRALEHRTAFREFRESALLRFTNQVQEFGSVFREMQMHRQAADYDPFLSLAQADILAMIDVAESAINDFLNASAEERREVAALVLFPSRG